MAYTTADLLTSVRVRGMLPDAATGSLSSASLLNLATEELHIVLVPIILSARASYFETYTDTALSDAVAAYPLPVRAVGGVVSGVQYIQGTSIRSLPLLNPMQIDTTQSNPTPRGHWFENNSIVVWPTPSSPSGTLRVRYFQRPNRLEQTSNCAQVVSIDSATQVTVGAAPSTWTTGTSVDFVQTAVPFKPYAIDKAIANVSGAALTFAALPSTLAVGDWIALAGYTPIPEIPVEFQPVLAQLAVVKALEAQGDREGMAAADAKAKIYLDQALKLITPRSQQNLRKVVSAWTRW